MSHKGNSYHSPVPVNPVYEEKESKTNNNVNGHSTNNNNFTPSKQRAIYSELLTKSKITPIPPSQSPNVVRPQSQASKHPLIASFRGLKFKSEENNNNSNNSSSINLSEFQSGANKLEPKVLVSFDQKPGKPPRRIEIERKKRLFASQDLNSLLLHNGGVNYTKYGLDVDHSRGTISYLPLEIFDDTSFESRSPNEWLELGRNPSTGQITIPARAVRFEIDEKTNRTTKGMFIPAIMFDYDFQTELYSIRYLDTQQVVKLPRIHIYFESESPFDFSQRVINAHKQRRELESFIRYSLYIDSMPSDEIIPLDTEQINRILLLALNTKKLKQNALDTTNLLNEVNIDYARTINKIIFDTNLKDPAQIDLKNQLQLSNEILNNNNNQLISSNNNSNKSRLTGCIPLPNHDFARHFSDFCFHSFYTRYEAISALIKINTECLKIRSFPLFQYNFTKSVRLEEFEQTESQQINQLSQYLREKWLLALKTSIKSSLRDVSKGWLNLSEKNREVYLYSKLKKFLRMIQFTMEDSLRYLVIENIEKYKNFIINQTKYKITVKALNQVKIELNNQENKTEQKDIEIITPTSSLFSTDLVFRDGIIQYSTTPAQFEQTVLFLFDKALQALFDLPNIESLVMEQLFFYSSENQLAPVYRQEPDMTKIYNYIQFRLKEATQPMIDYLQQFDKYKEFITLNVDEYVKSFAAKEPQMPNNNNTNINNIREKDKETKENTEGKYSKLESKENKEVKENKSDSKESKTNNANNAERDERTAKDHMLALNSHIEDIKRELNIQIALRTSIEVEIPKSIHLGLVSINCEDVRRKFQTKCSDLINKLLEYLAKIIRNRCEEVNKTMKKIESELRKQPQDIAELVKLREYCISVGQLVVAQRPLISDIIIQFELLESFQYRLPKDLFKLRWQLFSWPKTIHEQLISKELTLQSDRLTFLQEMRTNQDEFSAELLEIEKKVNSFGSYTDMEKLEKIREKVDLIHEKLEELANRSRAFNNSELLFNLQSTDYRSVTRVIKAFEPYYQLWTTTSDWMKNSEHWKHDNFLDLNGDNIQTLVSNYNKTMAKCLKSKAIRDNPGLLNVANNIKNQIEIFKPNLPLIIALRNPGMRDRHWELLSSKLPFKFQPDESTTLTRVLEEYKLQNYLEIIAKVGESAGKEYQIESSLQRMEDSWRGIEFDIQPYKKTGSYIVRGVDDIISLLDEHIITTQQMQFSPYKKVFEDRIQRWANKLNLVSEVIEEWLIVQKQWLSLQSIFNSADINKQLPAEGKRFASVNKTWRLIMSQVQANPDVTSFADNPGLLQKLQDSNKLLQMVQKRLSDYLDKKRSAFARFYFLANEELLQILSQTQDPKAVQPHLKKCFENIEKLEFTDNKDNSSDPNQNNIITAMFSAEGERIGLIKAVNPNHKKNVENWLSEVEQQMKDSIQYEINRSIIDYNNVDRVDWVKNWPGQCVLTGSQFHFTKEVEQALHNEGNKGIKDYLVKWEKQLISMVELVRGNLTPIQQQIMGALIVLDVHSRDVIERLVNENVTNKQDFAWVMQMRYYLEQSINHSGNNTNSIWVQMVQSKFPYGYEYLGNTLRLVITPLTDKCYLTLMTALQLHLGGSPAGPAGTGKTETVKDLAKALAKQCVVFNCSDGLNFLAMGKFFKGLASAGAWSCFDEFNRIDIEVLSVVAQQIMSIWNAVREGVRTFMFEDSEIKLDPTCGVFVTMNPGYAGRTELPDNLQSLFRPVAMMVPDYALIAQIMLYSFGYTRAVSLARKMVATFKLCSEQLSAQDHYDYGMRGIKTTITRAGVLKREEPNTDEDQLLLRALMDVNVPKFLKHDVPLFEAIIRDLFPTTDKPALDYGSITTSLIETCNETNLQPSTEFLSKCIQLYETVVVRHGVMLVGPAGGGKTSALRTLASAMTRLAHLESFSKVKINSLNPKAVTLNQLYGSFDTSTNEWYDGILAQIVRDCIDDTSKARKWIVFDGPVDAIWIESMNTVLDDNKKLCLVSGEILQLTPTMSMIFEVEDLAVASPATVSRCGMVYMEPEPTQNGGLNILVKSFINSRHQVFNDLKTRIQSCFDTLLEPSLLFIRKECIEPVPTVDNNLVKSLINLLESQQNPLIPVEGLTKTEDLEQQTNNYFNHFETQFVLALIWSVGSTVDKYGRSKFDRFLRNLLIGIKDCNNLPTTGTIYDYYYDHSHNQWIDWSKTNIVPEYKYDDRLSYSELIIPTQDSIRNQYWMNLLVMNKKQVLFTGNTGTGKTVNINNYLSSIQSDFITPINIMFSAATTANQIEDLLFSKMVKRRQRVRGPALGRKLVIFLDDMNMPAKELYGSQPPIELLRQWMDHNGFFDRRTLTFTEIVDISFIGAQGPSGGGRNNVTQRFLRHFNQIHQTELDTNSLNAIFSVIVNNFLSKFSEDIRNLSTQLVNATIDVYSTVISTLLPTPNKSHYTYNLRDLSAVFQGILSSSSRKITTDSTFLRLWIHENNRVFRDRLIDQKDRLWLDNLLIDTMKKQFNRDWDSIKPSNNNNSSGHSGRLLFGDYLEGMGAEQRFYDEVADINLAVKVMEESLSEYNDENSPMKLTMFLDAVDHTSRICRILRQPGGNALLLGVGGSGRQSLTKLACYMNEYELFQVEISKSYGLQEWHNDLRKLLLDCGLKEQPTVFLLSDTQIQNPIFYNDLNNILNSGEVPNLYSTEDLDNIQATCKIDCQRKNLPPTKLNTYIQFIHRVKQNLHVVFCMSPGTNTFRNRLRLFPALVNCCTIDWFDDWPEEALTSVANTSLTEQANKENKDKDNNNANSNSENELKFSNLPAIVTSMKSIHTSVHAASIQFKQELRRYNYVTPTSYLELLNIFKFLYNEKRLEIGGTRTKLQYGLDTLHSASEDITNLQLDLKNKQPKLLETQAEVESTMHQIAADRVDADQTKEIVEKQEADAALKAAECKEIKDSAQQELDQALPMLDQAVECLRELNKTHIDEVRNFKKPPPGVILTMEAACIMLRQKLKLKIVMKQDGNSMQKIPDYWSTATKYLLKQPKLLLQTLQTYDKDNIPESVIQKIKPYILREDFSVKRVETASVACRAICMWVHAMYNYYHVAILVEPKRVKLRQAEAEYQIVESTLNNAKERMKQVETRLKQLQDKYEALLLESEELTKGVELCKLKLDRANKLISGLGGERTRWLNTVHKLNGNYENITGDVLISSATIAYLGAFTSTYRSSLLEQWRNLLKINGINYTENCSVLSILGDPVQIRAWNIAGLPTDSVSVENGIIMSKARRWPLMIDPQSQASKFIKKLGAQKFESGMEVVKLSDKNFLHTFENAVRFGRWILLEGVGEELDAVLEPLLLQQIVNIKGVPHIRLGENTIPYNDQFHLYITTKLPNPHFPPELQVKVTLLNFTLTPEGLSDQMLGTVVAKESPELEQKKNTLVVQSARMKKQLVDTEDLILRMLSESKGDILEDEELINTLANSKRTSEEIAERVVEAETVELDIDKSRTVYTVVANRAQILYFCISELSLIDPMYQYSLQWFVNLFISAISQAPQSLNNNQQERLQNLNNFFTKLLYENVCRSLFEQHKLLFSFLLTVKINQNEKNNNNQIIDSLEWRFLVAGGSSSQSIKSNNTNTNNPNTNANSTRTANPAIGWLTDNSWNQIVALSELPNFNEFDRDFTQELATYKQLFDSSDPQNCVLSAKFQPKLSPFQRLLVLKCIRPDKVLPAISNWVKNTLGPEFVESPVFSLSHSYKDSNCLTPLIFILSRGADPTVKIMNFASEMLFREKITSISLGQGQGVIAARVMEEAIKKGHWVLLQNCHLAISWLSTLERIVSELKLEETHEDFRLFLTSMPTTEFPVSLLQNSIKITNEPPAGLKSNLQRTYLQFTDSQLNKSKKPKEFKKLLFSVSLFHSVIVDRKKFGPLGWNIPYQFTENDLNICITQLKDFIDLYENNSQIPYDVLHFLISNINYGGRITDNNDQLTIKTILNDFMNPLVLLDDYSFSTSGKYISLPTGTKDHYLKYINQLENKSETEIFGMHANAEIQADQNATTKLFETILTLLPRENNTVTTDNQENHNHSREKQLEEISLGILKQIPALFNLELIGQAYPISYSESMNTVLQQESIRYNKLLSIMKQSLLELNKALKGEMLMTDSLEEISASLYNNLVPNYWTKYAYPSLMSLSNWFNDLLKRIEFINNWITSGIPNIFWISGFFFPQAFLTGTLQNFARKTLKPIDTITFKFNILNTNKPEEIKSKPENGIYISGLYLQGCRWDLGQNSLSDSNPKELFTLFPVIHLQPQEIDTTANTNTNIFSYTANESGFYTYRCPVYKTLTRAGVLSTTGHSTNFIMYIDIPTKFRPEKWIKAGVALFCALNY